MELKETQGMDEMRYSSEVKEILMKKPSRIVRTGIPALGILFLILLTVSYFIPYPEGVECILFFGTSNNHLNMTIDTCPDAHIYLSEKDFHRFQSGRKVLITVKDCFKKRVTIEGKILTIDESAGFIFIRFSKPFIEQSILTTEKERSEPAFFHPQGCESVLITGESNILYEIFRPVISVFTRTRINKPE